MTSAPAHWCYSTIAIICFKVSPTHFKSYQNECEHWEHLTHNFLSYQYFQHSPNYIAVSVCRERKVSVCLLADTSHCSLCNSNAEIRNNASLVLIPYLLLWVFSFFTRLWPIENPI